MGFVRRYNSMPGSDVITQIEGVVIIDQNPPGIINGVGAGTVALVGEFADMTYAVTVDASGNVTSNPQPTECFGASDFLDKFGGFDPTLGDFQKQGGNGFVAIKNRRFSRLICCPAFLASPKGVRLFRDLPTCKSHTDPSPILPPTAAVVAAGTEFKDPSGYRIHTAAKVVFAGTSDYLRGVAGAKTAGAGGLFADASVNFITAGVQKGDILVLGVIGDATYGVNADTYRIVSVTDATDIVVENMDGTAISWSVGAGFPWRIHAGNTADSYGAGMAAADVGGYLIPARPITNTITEGTVCTPTVQATAPSGTSWDPLSNLYLRANPSNDVVFSATQGANYNGSGLDGAYQACLTALLANAAPANEINIVFSARHDTVINSSLKSHALSASAVGMGRIAVLSPSLDNINLTTILGTSDPGVGANRSDSVLYSWPGLQISVPDAVGDTIKVADGSNQTGGILDVTADSFLVSVLSLLAPERNPGQYTDPVPTCMSTVLGFQRLAPSLDINAYIAMKAAGICAPILDPDYGMVFESGVTTSLTPGLTTIARRRMANFIQDSLASGLKGFIKQPLTDNLRDAELQEIITFLDGLKSPNNPPAQRIANYSVDDVSGNTPALTAQGINVIIVNVTTDPTQDDLVLQTNIGPSVVITQTA